MSKPIILSGMQPTGSLHIGNYLGALKNWVDLQNAGEYEMFVFVADLHSLTVKLEPAVLREQTTLLAAEYIAAGVDPDKTTLFVQSQVPEHAELAWILNCVTPVGELKRMTQFKSKSGIDQMDFDEMEGKTNAGLLTYPVLMAADILLYHATHVPVGKDQTQHLEINNDIARWFNNRFGNYFKEIKWLPTEVPKVMSLVEPEKKMSKSAGEADYIGMGDEPNIIDKKLKRAVTATTGGGVAPGVDNLLTLLKQFGDKKTHEQFVVAERDGTIRYGDLKAELARAIATHFADFRARRAELLAQPKKLQKILEAGAEKAGVVAQKTMADVRKLVGIR